MDNPQKVYLAGPEVFLPDAVEIGSAKKALCQRYGFEGLFPLDNKVDLTKPGADRVIYRGNIALIEEAALGIFNLTPFRGLSADPGTVFELGVFIGQGKPIFAYSNSADDLLTRFKRSDDAVLEEATGAWADRFGMSVEDFGNADNLMIDACLAEQGRRFHRIEVAGRDRFRNLDRFIACLEEAQRAMPKTATATDLANADAGALLSG